MGRKIKDSIYLRGYFTRNNTIRRYCYRTEYAVLSGLKPGLVAGVTTKYNL